MLRVVQIQFEYPMRVCTHRNVVIRKANSSPDCSDLAATRPQDFEKPDLFWICECETLAPIVVTELFGEFIRYLNCLPSIPSTLQYQTDGSCAARG